MLFDLSLRVVTYLHNNFCHNSENLLQDTTFMLLVFYVKTTLHDLNKIKVANNMTEYKKYSRHISYEQFKILIDFMGQHIALATGCNRTLEARHKSKSLWNELTKMLNNSSLGTRKTSDGWSKYWSDFKNRLKTKVSLLKKRKRSGGFSKKMIKPLTRLEKRALVILGPHFEKNLSKHPSEIKLETYQENDDNDFSNTHSDISDRCSVELECNDSQNTSNGFEYDLEEDTSEPILQSTYPKWLIEVEKKRAEADLSRSKAEEKRAIISEKNAGAALIQAEALNKLADAATTQANALVRIANVLEQRGQRDDILPI